MGYPVLAGFAPAQARPVLSNKLIGGNAKSIRHPRKLNILNIHFVNKYFTHSEPREKPLTLVRVRDSGSPDKATILEHLFDIQAPLGYNSL